MTFGQFKQPFLTRSTSGKTVSGNVNAKIMLESSIGEDTTCKTVVEVRNISAVYGYDSYEVKHVTPYITSINGTHRTTVLAIILEEGKKE